MSEPIEIKIDGLKELQKAFSKAPDIVVEVLGPILQKSLILLQASARQFVQKDTSTLASKIITKTENALSGEVRADTDYAVFVHEGTKPHWPPIQAIEPWANRHSIPPFMVARSIAAKGTKANPFFDYAKEATQSDIFGFFDSAINNILTKLAA